MVTATQRRVLSFNQSNPSFLSGNNQVFHIFDASISIIAPISGTACGLAAIFIIVTYGDFSRI